MTEVYIPLLMGIGDTIRSRRETLGLSQQQVGEAVGVSQSAIDQIEREVTKRSKYLARIAQFLGIELSQLDPQITPPQNSDAFTPRATTLPSLDLPIYAAESADASGAFVLSKSPVDYDARPGRLNRVKDAYGIIVVGSIMEPELRAGDVVMVNPHVPPRAGDLAIFYRLDGKVLLRVFASETTDHYSVLQHNPPKRSQIAKESIKSVCRIVGRLIGT
jgi:transcriptional regulator with XRE-family HTH domain